MGLVVVEHLAAMSAGMAARVIDFAFACLSHEAMSLALVPEWSRPVAARLFELNWVIHSVCRSDTRQAEAIKLICISQNFNDRRARAAHSD
jgi:hypothetical protein